MMRLPEFEDCRDLEQLNGGDYFPQKELVCYASNHTNGIVIKNLKTNESVTVTAGGTGEGGPSFSPDGDKILFVSSKNGVGRQAFVYEIKSKSITQITHVKGAVMEPQWSPDGTKVLFSVITSGASQNASNSSDASNAASASSSAVSATQEQFVHDDDAVATEDFGYKFDGMGFIRPDTHWHLFAASADGTPAAGTPFQVFSNGVAGFLEMFGIPLYVAQCFMTMCVSALALTSLDAVARIGRMSFQELFSVDDMASAPVWRKVLCNKYFSTVLTLLCGFVLTRIGYANIWPLFGSANQLLSALVLVTLCVFLKVTGRSNKMLFPPLVIMLCVTGTALVQRTIALAKAYAAGSATFLVEGLQLIIAILLIVLGLTIVINSLRSYFAASRNSEKAA